MANLKIKNNSTRFDKTFSLLFPGKSAPLKSIFVLFLLVVCYVLYLFGRSSFLLMSLVPAFRQKGNYIQIYSQPALE
jgi:hypothetical protein